MKTELNDEQTAQLVKHAEHLGFATPEELAHFIVVQSLANPQFIGLMAAFAAKKSS